MNAADETRAKNRTAPPDGAAVTLRFTEDGPTLQVCLERLLAAHLR